MGDVGTPKLKRDTSSVANVCPAPSMSNQKTARKLRDIDHQSREIPARYRFLLVFAYGKKYNILASGVPQAP